MQTDFIHEPETVVQSEINNQCGWDSHRLSLLEFDAQLMLDAHLSVQVQVISADP